MDQKMHIRRNNMIYETVKLSTQRSTFTTQLRRVLQIEGWNKQTVPPPVNGAGKKTHPIKKIHFPKKYLKFQQGITMNKTHSSQCG